MMPTSLTASGHSASKIQLCSSSLLFSSLLFAFIYFIFFIVPRSWKSRWCEVRWPEWPVLRTTTTDPLARDRLIPVLRHVSTEIWSAPSLELHLLSWFVSFKSSFIYNSKSITVENRTRVHMIFLSGNDLRSNMWRYLCDFIGHYAHYESKVLWSVEMRRVVWSLSLLIYTYLLESVLIHEMWWVSDYQFRFYPVKNLKQTR